MRCFFLFLLVSNCLLANELFPFDEQVKGRYSPTAQKLSDYTLASTYAITLQSNMQIDDSEARTDAFGRLYLSQLLNYGATSIVKSWTQRKRPYTYSTSIDAQQYAQKNSYDTTRSFYSGHASSTFAIAHHLASNQFEQLSEEELNGYLFSSYFAASSTAALRVRAGKHFYSDILIGALAGTLTSHIANQVYTQDISNVKLSKTNWGAIATGTLLGFTWPHWFYGEKSNYSLHPVYNEQSAGVRFNSTW